MTEIQQTKPGKHSMGQDLAHKPLVEAILEVRWRLGDATPGVQIDPHYKFLLGRFYDRVHPDYPHNEALAEATLPEEIAGYTVQHRFRVAKDDWPLLQIGPGILSVNETSKYTWSDFRKRCVSAVNRLFEAHPAPDSLQVDNVVLRYIDAILLEESGGDVFAFLSDKMKVDIHLPEALFHDAGVSSLPLGFNWQSSFACQAPSGLVHLRFATGQREHKAAILLETMVQSAGRDVPAMPQDFENWIDAAHEITHDWFFKLIAGDLERGFRGERD